LLLTASYLEKEKRGFADFFVVLVNPPLFPANPAECLHKARLLDPGGLF